MMYLSVAIDNLVGAFRERGIEPPSTIRFATKEDGLKFALMLAKETGQEAIYRPYIAWLDINGIRFSWPMPGPPDIKGE